MKDKTNCPNCGAAIKHRYNHKCPYCGTFFDYRVERTEEINPRYLQNVKLIRFEKIPLSMDFVLIFEGDYVKWQESIEYGKDNTTIVLSSDDLKPKKIRYAIRIDYKDLRDIQGYDFDFIFRILPFEIDKQQFIEAMCEFNRNGGWYV